MFVLKLSGIQKWLTLSPRIVKVIPISLNSAIHPAAMNIFVLQLGIPIRIIVYAELDPLPVNPDPRKKSFLSNFIDDEILVLIIFIFKSNA
jgi:hypothetical protein